MYTNCCCGNAAFAGYQGTNKNFHVTADGGALFAAGNFNINLNSTGSNFNVRNDSSSVVDAFGVYKGGFTSNDRTVLISNDGSASFAARFSPGTTSLDDHAIVATNNNASNGVIVTQNMNNSGALFQGYNGSSAKNVEIFANGKSRVWYWFDPVMVLIFLLVAASTSDKMEHLVVF